MKVLITGAAGYIGSHLSSYLAENSSHDLVLADLNNQISTSGKEIHKVDLSDHETLDNLFKTERFDGVIHLAALLNAHLDRLGPLPFYEGNICTTISLLRMCSKYSVNKFVFPSSAAVYQPSESGILTEGSPRQPTDPYGRCKLICEDILKDTSVANQEFGYVVLRPFMVVGGGGTPRLDIKAATAAHPIKIAAQAALGKREKMVIFGDQYPTPDGTCVRDYVHMEDVCGMFSASLDYLQENKVSQVFNCGSSHGYSLKELATTMKIVTGVDFKVEIGEKRPQDWHSMVADITLAQDLLGWQPRHHDLEEFCRVTVELEKTLA